MAYPQSTYWVWPHQDAAVWCLFFFPSFPWLFFCPCIGIQYSGHGINGFSGYEELRFKFQVLHDLGTWRPPIVIKSLLCTKMHFRNCRGKARWQFFVKLSLQNHIKHFHHWSHLQHSNSFRKKRENVLGPNDTLKNSSNINTQSLLFIHTFIPFIFHSPTCQCIYEIFFNFFFENKDSKIECLPQKRSAVTMQRVSIHCSLIKQEQRKCQQRHTYLFIHTYPLSSRPDCCRLWRTMKVHRGL